MTTFSGYAALLCNSTADITQIVSTTNQHNSGKQCASIALQCIGAICATVSRHISQINITYFSVYKENGCKCIINKCAVIKLSNHTSHAKCMPQPKKCEIKHTTQTLSMKSLFFKIVKSRAPEPLLCT